MKRPNFEPIICTFDAAEEVDSKPIETFIPNQSYSLSELMSRFEKGQRLPAHHLFNPDSEFTSGAVYEETFDEAPPDDVRDVVDVEHYYREHQEHKREFTERKKKKKQGEGAQPPKQATDPQPQDPAKNDSPAGE